MKADPRTFRFDHALVAAVLLSGFVFDWRLAIPSCAVLLLGAAAFPGVAPTHRLWTILVAPRLPRAPVVADTLPWRKAALLSTAGLALASSFLFIDRIGLAWMAAVAVAGVGAVTGVGGLCLGCRARLRR